LRLVCIFALVCGATAFAQSSGPQVVAVSIDGEISPITPEIVGHAIEQAKS
jgi:membrane-bound ClpP family serine protease